MDIKLFVNITSRAWAIPILANLHEGIIGRQAALLTATGASRTAFAQSMEHLTKLGLLERNPGHGHPLRPEFRLTQIGKNVANLASRIHITAPKNDADLIRRSWTLPVLTALHISSHFNAIKHNLDCITDRALSHSLKSLEERRWVHRNVDDLSRPPRSIYRPINAGKAISGITGQEIRFS
ncbi:MAG: winged helix-turn-helix transcriptional regulator [Pseudomonadota bacterium]